MESAGSLNLTTACHLFLSWDKSSLQILILYLSHILILFSHCAQAFEVASSLQMSDWNSVQILVFPASATRFGHHAFLG
jgi:hypothetical protein